MWMVHFYIFSLVIYLSRSINGTITHLTIPRHFGLQELHKGRKHHLWAFVYFFTVAVWRPSIENRVSRNGWGGKHRWGKGEELFIFISLVCKGNWCSGKATAWSQILQNMQMGTNSAEIPQHNPIAVLWVQIRGITQTANEHCHL